MSFTEQRASQRTRYFLPAKIYFNDRKSVFDCRIKNLSSGGARLKMASTVGVPALFTLHIPHYDETKNCRVIWATGQELGVSFSLHGIQGTPDLQIV